MMEGTRARDQTGKKKRKGCGSMEKERCTTKGEEHALVNKKKEDFGRTRFRLQKKKRRNTGRWEVGST